MVPGPKRTILLIDDDPLVLESLKRLLELKGFAVTPASSVDQAVAQAENRPFDLVISDIRMPGQGGIQGVERIKALYEQKGLPAAFILITGYAEEDTPEHAIRFGVDKILFKPVDSEEFLRQVAEEIEILDKQRRLKEAPAPLLPAPRKKLKKQVPLRRAVITGIGVIAPSGIGKDAFWQGLREGKNCVDQITFFDPSAFPSKMGAEIRHFRPEDFIREPNEIRRMSRSAHLAVAASRLAAEDAGLTQADLKEAAVIVGSSTSGIEYLLPEAYAFERSGLGKVRPYVGIAGFVGSISSEISRHAGAQGPSHTLSTGCTSSTDAMGYALRQIQYGFTDTVITGGADACINDGILAAFCRMGAVSTRKDDFKKASRPFNRDRDGFVIGEGAWILILEEEEHALRRGARPYAELAGYGATCDAWHMAKPHPSGEPAALAVALALEDAGLAPSDVDLFEAYGNSTPVNDSYETAVIKKVFGRDAYRLAVPSIKSMLGHPIGAAGAGQVAAALLAIDRGFVHPTINYEVPDPACDLDYVPNRGREGKIKAAVCNSLAFGGKNAAVVLRKG